MRKLFYFLVGVAIAVVMGIWMYQARAASTLVPGGLVGYWKFNEGSASTTMDSSGNGNTGTLTNFAGPAAAWVTSRVGLNNALSFDGVNDSVNVGSGASLNNIRTLTISAWIYPKSFGEGSAGNLFGRVYDKRNTLGDGLSFFLCNTTTACSGSITNSIAFFQGFSSADGKWTPPSNSISLNTWTHIAVTYNNPSGLTTIDPVFYKNGILVSTTETVTPSGTIGDDSVSVATIGGNIAADRTFDGLIDEVRIYNRVLTLAEIKRIYSLRNLGGNGITR